MNEKFYQKTWFCIVMMFCCCFPLGIFLMWKYKKFNQPVRIIISAFFAIMIIISMVNGQTESETKSEIIESSIEENMNTEETNIDETTSVESIEETTMPEETTAAESEEEFKASCQEISYKTILRNPDDYIGQRIIITAKIQQVMKGGLFDDGEYYRIQTDESGYALYLDDEYFMYDIRPEGSTKLLQDDIIKIYAEFSGMQEIKRALTGTKEEIPAIKAHYIELISE